MRSPNTPVALLSHCWTLYWQGAHPELESTLEVLLEELEAKETAPSSPVWSLFCEAWLLLGHLQQARRQITQATSLFNAARVAAGKSHSKIHEIFSLTFIAEHALLADNTPLALDLIEEAMGLGRIEASSPYTEADILVFEGRVHALLAIILAKKQDRVSAFDEIALADRAARVLQKEHQIMGAIFGPENLKADCVFILLCLHEAENALKMAKGIKSTSLPIVRRAQLLADQGFAHGDLGDIEAEARLIEEACNLIPSFTKVEDAASAA